LAETYRWARQVDLARWRGILQLRGSPLVAVGSGGSLSLAHYAAQLNERLGGGVSRADTPLGVIEGTTDLRDTSVLVLSASGKNPDILAAYRKLLRAEPKQLVVVCSTIDSPLARLAKRYDEDSVLEFSSPAGKDGFLATNSLLATATLLFRSFVGDEPKSKDLPSSLEELIPRAAEMVGDALSIRGFLDRETLVALHGPDTEVAAIDLESKLTEAALERVQLADFRNFAHGRHHWLAKRSSESAVLSLETEADARLSRRTLGLLPSSVPKVRLRIPHGGCLAGLASLVAVFHVTNHYGRARSIDPGNPKVPLFGRRLYHLRIPDVTNGTGRQGLKTAAVDRKLSAIGSVDRGVRALLEVRYEHVVREMKGARFEALVLDYDGTICDSPRRFTGPEKSLVERLSNLADEGLQVAFATGRGKSVRSSLRTSFAKKLWNKIIVGYYNCGQIAPLSDDRAPDGSEFVNKELGAAAHILVEDKIISTLCEVTLRPQQITIASRSGSISEKVLWSLVNEALMRSGSKDVQVISSTHSVDVLVQGRSKVDLLKFLRDERKIQGQILSIGDRGAWPGNDFDLLSHSFSLSVDEVGTSPESAWNLAPVGLRGSRALVFYLDLLEKVSGRFMLHAGDAPKKALR
jgi:hypothetical protein